MAILADQRRSQALRAVDEVPAELTFNAGRDAVGRGFGDRLNFQDMAVTGPDLKAAAYTAIGADGFGAFDLRLAQRHIDFRNAGNRLHADTIFQRFNKVDQRTLQPFIHRGKGACVWLHGFFQQRIARANCDAMSAAYTAGTGDFRSAIPEHARMRLGVVNRQRLIDLDILTRFDTATA